LRRAAAFCLVVVAIWTSLLFALGACGSKRS